ncbi:hypothetical protein CTI12_AA560530 [Artemisia annua]|uniref:Protein FAR1-RELATED SEQUENCE n=1 Tax=Artemisia annua TaxID=35608 RepID=A0A2U1KUQ0_ARTAN|nr:hypothetical protein CTI12_AA560530 [Artemisia annua]
MDSIQNFDSFSSEEIVADLPTTSEEIVADLPTTSEDILVSEDVSAKYTEEIVAYEHGDESEAIKKISVGAWFCQIETKSLVEGSEVSIIREKKFFDELMEKKKAKLREKAKNKVMDKEEEPINLFSRPDGLYKVLRNIEDGSVYILRRWTKNLIPATLRNKRNIYGEKNEIVENYASEATSIVDYCVHMLSKDEPRLSAFVEKLKLLKIDVEADCPNPPSKDKLDNLEELIGVPKPAEKTVNNPSLGNPNGRKKLRIKGGKEQALEKNKKNKNACSLCGETDGHKRRTCPKKYAVEDELDQPEVTREEDNLDQSDVTA